MARSTRIFQESLLEHLTYSLAKDSFSATQRDKHDSVVLSVREQLVENWIKTQQRYYDVSAKRVYYLSLEFLLGRLLHSYISNLGLLGQYSGSLDVFGLSYEELLELEWDAGLGNGGLGRLAACFLDSLASLQYPAYGYGIRYEYGIFAQKIRDGYQVETPDNWLRYGNRWEFQRPEILYPVRFYGHVSSIMYGGGRMRMVWQDTEEVMAMAFDYPVPGYRNGTVNTLRLWSAKSSRDFNLEYFNSGDYMKAMEDKNQSENISKVLYPDDQTTAGKELRLKQQYFFVTATLRDIIRRYRKFHKTYNALPDKVAVQLNDTHPSIAIAELMRILVDEEGMAWDDSWEIVRRVFAYTNHTVLPEALETWSEGLFGHLLPRHLQIIHEIDRRFQVDVQAQFPNEPNRAANTAIVTGEGDRRVHMARLAIIGSHTVNGVSALHSELLKSTVFADFHIMSPGKFTNVTNGITHRRWLIEANPQLSSLICEAIGDKWMFDLNELHALEPFAEDGEFIRKFRGVKQANKEDFSGHLGLIAEHTFRPQFLLDCQVKRMHEYKRQMLNVLHAIVLYNRLREGRVDETFVPRTILFAGKSAPGYWMCKLIIKLIHAVGESIANNNVVREKLQVIFVPNYSVSLAQHIMPAAELSEQISTAGFEASGTGNMKFTLNGALTIGTLDGANVEIREEVGDENFFLFGHTTEEVVAMRSSYRPQEYYEKDQELRQALNQLLEGHFSHDNPGLFHPIVRSLLDSDWFFVLADFASYLACQERVSATYRDWRVWTRMAVLNVARAGKFSSDRAIKEYAERIWNVPAVKANP
ncbi:MAG TPA: glycogen/starch/alpha-glucan phosphorylase [Dissulfurispiraceae bacterium]|nr:glycogen/starch/alpha-glucan phosphorylase [Dissulfurispiraceae bacterium]